MSLRSEFYHRMDEISLRMVTMADRFQQISEKINTHVVVCTEERRADEQWRESAQRILESVQKSVRDHTMDDEEYQEKMVGVLEGIKNSVTNNRTNAQKWLISVLLGLIGSLCIIIGTLFWKLQGW